MGQVLHHSQETLYIVKRPGTSPFTDALHFVSIHMYSSVIYHMTKAFQSLSVKVNFTLAKKEMGSLNCWNMIPRCFSCSLIEHEYIKILSRYTWMNQLMQSQKIAVISHWNIEGVLQSPICITWLLNVPSTVVNAILWMCSSKCEFVHIPQTY